MSSIRDPRPVTLAALKSGVVASLIETYLEFNQEFSNSLPRGAHGITLKAPGIVQNISIGNGHSGVILIFPRHGDMIAVLSGLKGMVIPLPNGLSFFTALKSFKLCTRAVAAAMSFIPEDKDLTGIENKTPLLLAAALRGVCEVYNHDHWMKLKSSQIPAGSIGIKVADNPSLGGVITIEKGHMSLDLKKESKTVNANLQFKSCQVCYRVLTGNLPAMAAVGDGRIILRGKLPLIQGLFPLLDRFGELMS